MYLKAKRTIYNLIRDDDENNLAASIFDCVIIFLIVVNVFLVILDTFQGLPELALKIFYHIEVVSVVIFTIEYLLRLWTSDFMRPFVPALKARLFYVFSFMAIVDLLAILPFYLPLIINIDLRILRMIRLFRLLRILKLNRYTSALSSVSAVIKKKAAQLISSMLVVLVLMVMTSVLMYHIESEAQPDVFRNAFSGMWWAVATLTTVGYGDIYPITWVGKFLSAVIALLGIGFVAVPTGIISAGFMEGMDSSSDETHDEKKRYCPYCGKKID